MLHVKLRLLRLLRLSLTVATALPLYFHLFRRIGRNGVVAIVLILCFIKPFAAEQSRKTRKTSTRAAIIRQAVLFLRSSKFFRCDHLATSRLISFYRAIPAPRYAP